MIEWRVVQRFPGYEISELGTVRRLTGGQGAVAGKELKWHTQTSTGYPDVRLRADGKVYSICVHRLMAEAFLGPRPDGAQIRHLDGDKMNCRRTNIAYGTAKENGQDKVRHGRSSAGEKNPMAKITKDQAQEIRKLRSNGVSAKQLAEQFSLNACTVHRIVANVYWQEASNRGMDRATR